MSVPLHRVVTEGDERDGKLHGLHDLVVKDAVAGDDDFVLGQQVCPSSMLFGTQI